MGFDFEWQSFGLGVGAGVITTLAAQRAWQFAQQTFAQPDQLSTSRRTLGIQIGHRRYNRDLLQQCLNSHLGSDLTTFNHVMIEPRFIRSDDLVEMPDDDVGDPNVFRGVPIVHKYPYLYAPYNIHTISIRDLGFGERFTLLMGASGSGRTTALLSIALFSLGQSANTLDEDMIAKRLDSKDSELSSEERAERIKRRTQIDQEITSKISQDSSDNLSQEEIESLGKDKDSLSRFETSAPLYVHLSNIQFKRGFGNQIDPAEPLVRALQSQVRTLTRRTMPKTIYSLIKRGRALLLLDGLDSLSEEAQQDRILWLKAFIETYPDNSIVMTYEPTQYKPFVDLGFVPVYLRAWDDANIQTYTKQWYSTWASKQSDDIPTISDDDLTYLANNLRGLTPSDITFQLWREFESHKEANKPINDDGADQEENISEPDERHQILKYMHRVLGQDEAEWESILQRLAILELRYGYIEANTVIQFAIEHDIFIPGITKSQNGEQAGMIPSVIVNMAKNATSDTSAKETTDTSNTTEDPNSDEITVDDRLDDLRSDSAIEPNDDADHAEVSNNESDEEDTDEQKRVRQITRDQRKLLALLVKKRILIPYVGDRYRFAHCPVVDYFASLIIGDAIPLESVIDDAPWQRAIGYASERIDITPAIGYFIDQMHDVAFEHILHTTQWLRFASDETEWRNEVLRYLGNVLFAPNQYDTIREYIVSALISSRDRGSLVIFRRAIQHPSPTLRRLACLSLGVLRDEQAINPLGEVLYGDMNEEVRIAATIALGAIGTNDALEIMVGAMIDSDSERVQRAAGEMLAQRVDVGHDTLYDALEHENVLVKRAAIFGMGRIGTDSSLVAVNDVYQTDDEEWYAKSAAEVVFIEAYSIERRLTTTYPQIGSMPWMIEWGTQQSLSGAIPSDIGGIDLVVYALQYRDDAVIRLLAAQTIGQLCLIEAIEPLYNALGDREKTVRDAAYRGLANMQNYTGITLPAPV